MKRKRMISILIAALALACVLCTALVACGKDKEKEAPLTLHFHSNFGEDQVVDATCLRSEISGKRFFEREGYGFVGWSRSGDSQAIISDKTVINDGANLYAVWKINVYTVRFLSDGVEVCEPQSVTHGESATAPDFLDFWDKVPSGSKFAGWKQQFDEVKSDLDVEADLIESDLQVEFVNPFETNKRYFGYGAMNGDVVPEPPVEPAARKGYKFVGWRTRTGTFYTNDRQHYTNDVTYFAVFAIDEAQLAATISGPSEVTYGDDRVTFTAEITKPASDIDYTTSKWTKTGGTVIGENRTELVISSTDLGVGEFTISYELTARHTPTSDSDIESTAVATATFDVRVAKRGATIRFDAPLNARQNWSGGPITFDLSPATLSDETASVFVGEPTFTYTLNGEAVDLNSISLVDGGEYTLTATLAETEYFASASATFKLAINSVKVFVRSAKGTRPYPDANTLFTLERALALDPLSAEIALKADETLVLMPIATTLLSAGEYTLNSRARLALPYEPGDDLKMYDHRTGTEYVFYVDVSNESEFLKLDLKLQRGATLNVEGNVQIGGVGSNEQLMSFQGATQGDYAQITLNEGSTLAVKKGGKIENHGYIKGDGEMIVEADGAVYTTFVVRDFRGGTNTTGVFMPNSSNTKAKEPICPFNQYDFPNIQAAQKIYSGAGVYAYCSLYASSTHNEPAVEDAPLIIGKKNALLNLTSGYIAIKVTEGYNAEIASRLTSDWSLAADAYPTTLKLDIFGDAEIGALQLAVQGVTVKTSSTLFAVPYNFDIAVKSGATLSMPYSAKLLSGAKLTVDKGATFVLAAKAGTTGGKLVVYDGEWEDHSNSGAFVYPKNKGAAIFTVNGTFRIEAANKNAVPAFGGMITSSEQGAEVIVGAGATTSVNAFEGSTKTNGIFGGGMSDSDLTYDKLYASSLNGYEGAITAGKTYAFDGATWVQK